MSSLNKFCRSEIPSSGKSEIFGASFQSFHAYLRFETIFRIWPQTRQKGFVEDSTYDNSNNNDDSKNNDTAGNESNDGGVNIDFDGVISDALLMFEEEPILRGMSEKDARIP